jgi:hypothetical protein
MRRWLEKLFSKVDRAPLRRKNVGTYNRLTSEVRSG